MDEGNHITYIVHLITDEMDNVCDRGGQEILIKVWAEREPGETTGTK